MDYPVWKKKSKTPQFLAFHKAHQLDAPKVPSTSSPLISAVSTTTAASAVAAPSSQTTLASGGSQTPQHRVPIGGTTATLTSGGGARMSSGAGQQRAGVSGAPVGQQQQLPHGAEIKISGVGVTPVAVSTKLPAAVVQLSQQGRLGCTRDTWFFSPICFFFGVWFDKLSHDVCGFWLVLCVTFMFCKMQHFLLLNIYFWFSDGRPVRVRFLLIHVLLTTNLTTTNLTRTP